MSSMTNPFSNNHSSFCLTTISIGNKQKQAPSIINFTGREHNSSLQLYKEDPQNVSWMNGRIAVAYSYTSYTFSHFLEIHGLAAAVNHRTCVFVLCLPLKSQYSSSQWVFPSVVCTASTLRSAAERTRFTSHFILTSAAAAAAAAFEERLLFCVI